MSFATIERVGRTSLRVLQKEIEQMEKKVRIAGGIALTKTAKIAQKNMQTEMMRVFDRPTRWTLNATYVRPATKQNNNEVKIGLKDAELKNRGVPPVNHLYAQIHGGTRQQKRHEVALQRIGVLPPGWRIVPGQGAELDRYGNMKSQQIVQIMSYFRSFGEQGYKANSTAQTRKRLQRGTKKKAGRSYFVAYPGRERTKHLQPGIYVVRHSALGSAIKPVMIFVKEARYTPRLQWYKIVNDTFERHLDDEFEKQIEIGLAR